MAFAKEAGYGNLPNGNFSPTIFSKKAQLEFRKKAVVPAISTDEYFGEIKDAGDTVRIIKEPTVVINPYKRGTQLVLQDLDDDELTLTVDQASYFNFALDDIEKKQSLVSFEELAGNNAAYRMKDDMDKNVLAYTATQVLASNTLGAASPITIGFASGQMSPLAVMNRVKRWMAQGNIPEENRWAVVDPIFTELLESEDSKLINRDYDPNSNVLRNGKVTAGTIRGFNVYESNNLPVQGNGPESATAGDYGWILFGWKGALATASQIDKVEKYRPHQTFADAVKGLHLYGRKVLRPEAVFGVKYRIG